MKKLFKQIIRNSKYPIQKFLISLSGNAKTQRFFADTVDYCQYLMGIGSGTGVDVSGEIAVLKILTDHAYTQDHWCLFDVGANKGQFLKMLLRKIGEKNIHVHAFEPSIHSYEILRESLEQNPKITLNNFGLGRECGSFDLFFDQPGSTLASLSKRKLDHFNIAFEMSETVTIETLDNYCAKNNITHIDLLKIDVEGAELDVLSGSSKMFARQAIKIVTFEFGGCNIDTRTYFRDFYYFFKGINMKILRITPSGYLVPITKYQEVQEQFRTTNFVAIYE